MAFLEVPESDYQADEPVINPIEVTMSFDDPKTKEHTKGDRSWTGHYYGVQFNGADYTLSASDALHKLIQATGATKGTTVKIIKKRIGPNNKDIRWSASYVSGPQDQDKIDAADSGDDQAQPATSPPKQRQERTTSTMAQSQGGTKVYYPLKGNDDYMNLVGALADDRIAVWNTIYERIVNDYPDETSEWQATRATHISIAIEKDLYHKWEKEQYTVAVPEPDPEDIYDERELRVFRSDANGFMDAVIAGHDILGETDRAKEIVKKFGFTGLPKGDKAAWVDIARIVWRYCDRKEQGFEEYYAMVGTADEFLLPHEVMKLPPKPDSDKTASQNEEDSIPF